MQKEIRVTFRLTLEEFQKFNGLVVRTRSWNLSRLIRNALEEMLKQNPPPEGLQDAVCPTMPALSDSGSNMATSDKRTAGGRLSDKSRRPKRPTKKR